MDERWVVLLNYWLQQEFRHALTFPFLIGALRIPAGASTPSRGDAKGELEALVDVMRSHSAEGYFHHVYRCPDLNHLVVTKVANSVPPSSSFAIAPGRSNSVPTLYSAEGVSPGSSSPFSSLVETIWKEVGTAIEAGNFSCRGNHFGPFSDDDLRIICRALA